MDHHAYHLKFFYFDFSRTDISIVDINGCLVYVISIRL